MPRLIEEQGEDGYFKGKWAKGGPEVVNTIGCGDCHEKARQNCVYPSFAERALEA